MILFIVFLVLKLCGVITWSWWWVTAPLWIPFCLAFAVGTTMAVLGLIVLLFASISKSRSGY
jgi:hypothetical protein